MALSHNPPTVINDLIFYFDATNASTWNAGIPAANPGEAIYTTPGTYSWTAPAGVTSVSAVCVGGGGSGAAGGGGLGWKNNIAVVPGNSYNIVVGSYGTSGDYRGSNSYFISSITVMGEGGGGTPGQGGSAVGGSYVGDGGGNGGNGIYIASPGGGGAGGYSGPGGNASYSNLSGTDGAGGGGGGGTNARGGGGVGLYGEGASGKGGTGDGDATTASGKGGSGGTDGNVTSAGSFGGGGAYFTGTYDGASGAVRLVWPGNARRFPSLGVANNSVSNSIVGLINSGQTYTANNLIYETENRGRLRFTGNNSFMTSTYATTAGQALTVAGWLHSSETGSNTRCFFDSVSAKPMIWWNASGQIEFDNGDYNTTGVRRNEWVHVALSKPSGSSIATYYINGSRVGSGSAYSISAVTPTWFNRAGSNSWNGYCGVFQVYNRDLSALEIKNNYDVHKERYGL